MSTHHDSSKYHYSKYRDLPKKVIYIEKRANALSDDPGPIYKEKFLKAFNYDSLLEEEKIAELISICKVCFSKKVLQPENLKEFKLDMRDAFVKTEIRRDADRYDKSNWGNSGNNYREREEPIPEWAKEDVTLDFKDFEFKTIDKPSRPKKENEEKSKPKPSAHKLEQDLKKLLTQNKEGDDFYYASVDDIMEAKLKEMNFNDEEEAVVEVEEEEEETKQNIKDVSSDDGHHSDEEIKHTTWETISPDDMNRILKESVGTIGRPVKEVSKPSPPIVTPSVVNPNINLTQQIGRTSPVPSMPMPPMNSMPPMASIDPLEASFIGIYPPNKDYNTIHLFSLFIQKLGVCDLNELVWYYKDPQGDIQGPFSSIDMDCWNLDKYFPYQLPIAFIQTAQFITIEFFRGSPYTLVKLAQRFSSTANAFLAPFLMKNNGFPDMKSYLLQQLSAQPQNNMNNMFYQMPQMPISQRNVNNQMPTPNLGVPTIGPQALSSNIGIQGMGFPMPMMGFGGVGGGGVDPFAQLLKIVNNNNINSNLLNANNALNNHNPALNSNLNVNMGNVQMQKSTPINQMNNNLHGDIRNNLAFQKQQMGTPSASQPANLGSINTNNLKMMLGLGSGGNAGIQNIPIAQNAPSNPKCKDDKRDFPSLSEAMGKH